MQNHGKIAAPIALAAALLLGGMPARLPAQEGNGEGGAERRPSRGSNVRSRNSNNNDGKATQNNQGNASSNQGNQSNQNRRNNQGQQGNRSNQGGNQGNRSGQPQQGQSGRPQSGTPARATAPKAPAGPSLGEFKMQVDRDSRILRLHGRGTPERGDVSVIVGDEFSTDLSFVNPGNTPFDHVRLILSYNTADLQPLAINDYAIAGRLAGDPTSEVDDKAGLLLYEGRFGAPATVDAGPLLSIRWKALRTTQSSRIEFGQLNEIVSAVEGEGEDLLGNSRTPGDGTLDLTVSILPEDPRAAEALLTNPSLYTKTDEKIGGVTLALQGPAEPVAVGEPFTIDVVLDNRTYSNLDGLSILIAFDPAVVEVLDADKDNFITRETNILDGSFRKQFPWDFHVDNSVSNRRGTILYRAGTSDDRLTRGKTGTVARIYAQAKRPTAATKFEFRFPPAPGTRGTEATYVGEDVLGDPKVAGDGVRGYVLTVRAQDPPAEAKP